MNFKTSMIMILVLALATGAHAASGSIWTTQIDCGDSTQDANHYAAGDTVFINGQGFAAGTYPWQIKGNPGGASNDPNIVVESGNITTNGSFCFAAYVVLGDDGGEYKVAVGGKGDNYRVDDRNASGDTCEEALAKGFLKGSIVNGTAIVNNSAKQSFTVSLASYQMYAALIDDQTIFDYDTKVVKAGKTATLNVDVPLCAYQIDLVCGDPITDEAPWYGAKVIASDFVNQNNFCTQTKHSSSPTVSATLSVAPWFPQNKSYVFICTANNFTATNYNWYYGDGQILYNTTLDNTFHTFAPGNFTVACTATDGTNQATDVLKVVV